MAIRGFVTVFVLYFYCIESRELNGSFAAVFGTEVMGYQKAYVLRIAQILSGEGVQAVTCARPFRTGFVS